MKKIFSISLLILGAFLFSGCSLPSTSKSSSGPLSNATVIKSIDGGIAWQSKIKIDDKKTIASVDVLSMAIDPVDSRIIYIGTQANGLFVSKDGAETWSQLQLAEKIYNVVFDPLDHNVMYATAVLNGRAKIFKRLKEGENWKEIYTEPADGTVITSLAINSVNSQVIFAGTTGGVIVKTTDGGLTWANIKKAAGPVAGIVFDSSNDWHLFFLVFQIGVLETKDGGKTIEDVTQKVDAEKHSTSFFSIANDQAVGGAIYVGTGSGIFEKIGNSDLWKPINIIESSKAFPIRAIAVNPLNPQEIMYSAAQAIYKSVDGGTTWATFQLDAAKDISVLRYDRSDPLKIYAGLRKY
ncbi:MAG: hypothetical protein WCF93_01700 [Candidatus Moraniibacteriota bacterium]